jgi:hypothetical protein
VEAVKFIKKNALTLAVIGYVIVGIVTFGHAASRANKVKDTQTPSDAIIARGHTRVLCGAVWPLYWSWWVLEVKP